MKDRHGYISGDLLSYLDFFMQIIALRRIGRHIG